MPDASLEFTTDDVEISDDGRVIINNPAFAKMLVTHVRKTVPDIGTTGIFDNCDCPKNASNAVRLSNVMATTKLRLDPVSAGIFDNCDCSGKLTAKTDAIRKR